MLVSVVIPTHNRPDMLAEALASVRAQTFADYEIIVVSNGENVEMRQASRDTAIEYGARYIALSDGNASAARNCAVERARAANGSRSSMMMISGCPKSWSANLPKQGMPMPIW